MEKSNLKEQLRGGVSSWNLLEFASWASGDITSAVAKKKLGNSTWNWASWVQLWETSALFMMETGLFNQKKVKLKKKNTEKKLLFLVYIFNCSIKSVYCLMKNTWIMPNNDICFHILWFPFKSKTKQNGSQSRMTLISRGGALQNETGEGNHDLFFPLFWVVSWDPHPVIVWHI